MTFLILWNMENTNKVWVCLCRLFPGSLFDSFIAVNVTGANIQYVMYNGGNIKTKIDWDKLSPSLIDFSIIVKYGKCYQ